jgi:hypothetical protein
MSWVTCFNYHNLTQGDIAELSALYIHTDMGSGIVPVQFIVVTPFYLNGVDFIDLIYHAKQYQRTKIPIECLAGTRITAEKEPKLKLVIVHPTKIGG